MICIKILQYYGGEDMRLIMAAVITGFILFSVPAGITSAEAAKKKIPKPICSKTVITTKSALVVSKPKVIGVDAITGDNRHAWLKVYDHADKWVHDYLGTDDVKAVSMYGPSTLYQIETSNEETALACLARLKKHGITGVAVGYQCKINTEDFKNDDYGHYDFSLLDKVEVAHVNGYDEPLVVESNVDIVYYGQPRLGYSDKENYISQTQVVMKIFRLYGYSSCVHEGTRENVYPEYNDYLKVAQKAKEIEVQIDKLGITDKEKIERLNDYIIKNWKYDFSAITAEAKSERNKNFIDAHSYYGAIVNSKAVCEGIAKGAKYICDDLKIPCIVAEYDGGGNEDKAHAWNVVYINGEWKYVDFTANNGLQSNRYLFVGASEMEKDDWVKVNIQNVKKTLKMSYPDLADAPIAK